MYMCISVVVSSEKHCPKSFELGPVGMSDVLIRGTPAYDCVEWYDTLSDQIYIDIEASVCNGAGACP